MNSNGHCHFSVFQNSVEVMTDKCESENTVSDTSLYQCCCSDCNCTKFSASSSRITENNVKYFLRDEVAVHNKLQDFWVILHGNVLDLTMFLKTRQDSMTCV